MTITAQLTNTALSDDDVGAWLTWLRGALAWVTCFEWGWWGGDGDPDLSVKTQGHLIRKQNFELTFPTLDLSSNNLSKDSIKRICSFLEEHAVRVEEMKFDHNDIDDDGLYRIAQYITSAMAPISSLHLSSNRISMQGVFRLLTMLSLHPMYPVETSRQGKAAFVPLWLQLGNSLIQDDDLQAFLDSQLCELGCAVCLVNERCSPKFCQHVHEMKLNTKHNDAWQNPNLDLSLCAQTSVITAPDSSLSTASCNNNNKKNKNKDGSKVVINPFDTNSYNNTKNNNPGSAAPLPARAWRQASRPAHSPGCRPVGVGHVGCGE